MGIGDILLRFFGKIPCEIETQLSPSEHMNEHDSYHDDLIQNEPLLPSRIFQSDLWNDDINDEYLGIEGYNIRPTLGQTRVRNIYRASRIVITL